MPGPRDLVIALLATAGCDPPYEPPCRITDRQPALLEGFTPRLVPTGTGEIVAIGEAVEPSEDASERLVEVALLDVEGRVVDGWSLTTTVPAVEVLGAEVRSQLLWAGEDLVELRTDGEELPPDEAGERHRTTLTFRRGSPAAIHELRETACVNCLLTWRAAALDEQILVVYSPRALSTDVKKPLRPARVHYLVLSPDGEVTASGLFPWRATVEPIGDLRVLPAGDGFALETPDGLRLIDRELRQMAGPLEVHPDAGSWAVDASDDTVTVAWTDRRGNVLVRTFERDGSPIGLARRLSEGHVTAVRRAGDRVGAVLWGAGRAWFAAASPEGKLGGDLELPSERGTLLRPDALFAGDTAFFLVSPGRVDRVEVDCVE